MCPAWVMAQQSEEQGEAAFVQQQGCKAPGTIMPKLTGRSFWQSLLKEPYQVKCLHQETTNKLSFTQGDLITRLPGDHDCGDHC